MKQVIIDGQSLTIETVIELAHDPAIHVNLSNEAVERINKASEAVANFIETGQIAYGITTGFGAFKDRLIPLQDVEKLQENIILSHAVGVGDALDEATTRAMMLIRANTLAKGHSGIRLQVLELLLALLNHNVLPLIPEKGSLGASGDLAPLAHMSLPLIGQGYVIFEGELRPSLEVLEELKLQPVRLAAKEGLALTNGTTLMTAIGTLMVHHAENILRSGNLAAAITLEAQNGTTRAYTHQIHAIRPQTGQVEIAAMMRDILQNSNLTRPDDPTNIQDAYTLRCVPQVHGAVAHTLSFVRGVIETELNSVTDNPLLFWDENDQPFIVSGGNFHGEPLALALDYLAIAFADLGNMSERRIAKLVDSKPESNTYPDFLIAKGGVNSGFMLLQYTAAALASENKSLAHPSSLDSIPSSGNVEDHVSMGALAAVHCRQVLKNVAMIIAIELMSACQAVDFRLQDLPNAMMGDGTSKAYELLRKHVPFFEADTWFQPYMLTLSDMVWDGEFAKLI